MTHTDCMQRGQIAVELRDFPEALQWFERALAMSPKDPQTLACVGQTQCWLGCLATGVARLREAGRVLLKKARKSGDIGLVLGLAEQLQFWNDFAGAVELCQGAVRISPTVVRGYQLLALGLIRLNRAEAALTAARQAVRLAPDSAMLHILLATVESADRRYQTARERLEKVLAQRLAPEEAFRAHKEMAGVLERLGEYDKVFGHLHTAGEIAATLPEVRRQDATLVPAMLETHRAGFDRDLLGRWAEADLDGTPPAPIFVMGFMRSGTTLTQEVLAAHPEVFLADETDLMVQVAEELRRLVPSGATMADRLRALDLAGVRHLRGYYWRKVSERYGDELNGRRLVDKTTMNTIDLGLINHLFPDSRVVFVLRDPRDVVLSCFQQVMVPTPSTVHLLNWRDTAAFYSLVMDWWITIRRRLTLSFVEFRYEDAVTDFERTFRDVFAALELPWDPCVAGFHARAAERYVNSPSFNQVAQPLYASSIGRWRRYAAEYAPIAETLRPAITAFGYGD